MSTVHSLNCDDIPFIGHACGAVLHPVLDDGEVVGVEEAHEWVCVGCGEVLDEGDVRDAFDHAVLVLAPGCRVEA